MRVRRSYKKFASLYGVVALYLCAAVPAHAALVFTDYSPIPDTDTFNITLTSTAELTAVGFDYALVTFSHSPTVTLLDAVAGAALPAPAAPLPGWTVFPTDQTVKVEHDSNIDGSGILPAGPLIVLTFQGPRALIVASLMPYDLDDNPRLDTPLTTPVPEPSSWLLLAAGLGAVGFNAGRRRA